MKRIALIFALTVNGICLSAQISIGNKNLETGSIEEVEPTIAQYDSLSPIEFDKYKENENKKFIGQIWYLPPKISDIIFLTNHMTKIQLFKKQTSVSDDSQNNDFVGGLKNGKEVNEIWTTIYKPQKELETTKFTCLDSVVNRYYKIVDQIYISTNDPNYELDHKFVSKLSVKEKEVYNLIAYENLPDTIDFTAGKDYYDLNDGILFIKLVDIKSGDTVYTTEIDKFISVGFFQKAKKLYEGRNFIWAPEHSINNKNSITDYFTGNIIDEDVVGNKFKCIGVDLYQNKDNKEGWSIVAILECGNIKISTLVESLNNYPSESYIQRILGLNYNINSSKIKLPKLTPSLLSDFYLEEDYKKLELYANDLKQEAHYNAQKEKNAEQIITNNKLKAKELFLQNCIKKYGTEYGRLVANGKISIGMTKSMCQDAWFNRDFNVPMYKVVSIETKYGRTEVWTNNSISQKLYIVNGTVKEILKY